MLETEDGGDLRIDGKPAPSSQVTTYLHLLRSPHLGYAQEAVGLLEVDGHPYAFVVFGPFNNAPRSVCQPPNKGFFSRQAASATAPDKARLQELLLPRSGVEVADEDMDMNVALRSSKHATSCVWNSKIPTSPGGTASASEYGCRLETKVYKPKDTQFPVLELDIAVCNGREGVRQACQRALALALLAYPDPADVSPYVRLRAKPSFERKQVSPDANRAKGCSLVNLYHTWGFVDCTAATLNYYDDKKTNALWKGVKQELDSGLDHFVAILQSCVPRLEVYLLGHWNLKIHDKREVGCVGVYFGKPIPTMCVTRACQDIGMSEKIHLMDAYLQGPCSLVFAWSPLDPQKEDDSDHALQTLAAHYPGTSGYKFFGKDISHTDAAVDIKGRHPWYKATEGWLYATRELVGYDDHGNEQAGAPTLQKLQPIPKARPPLSVTPPRAYTTDVQPISGMLPQMQLDADLQFGMRQMWRMRHQAEAIAKTTKNLVEQLKEFDKMAEESSLQLQSRETATSPQDEFRVRAFREARNELQQIRKTAADKLQAVTPLVGPLASPGQWAIINEARARWSAKRTQPAQKRSASPSSNPPAKRLSP